MKPPSDHLLRTLAAIPVSSHILDLGCGVGRHTEPLLRLGFPVHACDARERAVQQTRARIQELVGAETAERCVRVVAKDGFDVYPEAAFDWVVAYEPIAYLSSSDDLTSLLTEARRLLKPGGWIYVALAAEPEPAVNGTIADAPLIPPEHLAACAETAGLARSVAPARAEEHGTPLVRAIFRRVEEETPV